MTDGLSPIETAENKPQAEHENIPKVPQFLADALKKYPVETIPEVATFQFVGEHDGDVEDIVYTQNANTISLKEEFPGDYSLFIHHITREKLKDRQRYNHYTGGRNEATLTLVEGETDPFNISVLHEVGHALDEKTERKQSVDRAETASLVRSRVMDTLIDEPVSAEQLKKIFYEIADANVLQEDGREELFDSISQEYGSYKQLDPKDRKKLVDRIAEEHLTFRTECLLSHEQIAWVHVLEGIQKLRGKGINVYGGSETELANMISELYSTYQEIPSVPTSTLVASKTPSRLASIRQALRRIASK